MIDLFTAIGAILISWLWGKMVIELLYEFSKWKRKPSTLTMWMARDKDHKIFHGWNDAIR